MRFMEIEGVLSGICNLFKSLQISSNPHLHHQTESQ
jgi:hypothetical protein